MQDGRLDIFKITKSFRGKHTIAMSTNQSTRINGGHGIIDFSLMLEPPARSSFDLLLPELTIWTDFENNVSSNALKEQCSPSDRGIKTNIAVFPVSRLEQNIAVSFVVWNLPSTVNVDDNSCSAMTRYDGVGNGAAQNPSYDEEEYPSFELWAVVGYPVEHGCKRNEGNHNDICTTGRQSITGLRDVKAVDLDMGIGVSGIMPLGIMLLIIGSNISMATT